MSTFAFTVNRSSVTVESDPDRTLLDVLREDLNLTGTKYSCGKAIAFSNERVTNGSLKDYKVPRFDDLPELHVVNVVPQGTEDSAGETPIMAIAPAIANAVFAATGKMPRTLPIDAGPQPGQA